MTERDIEDMLRRADWGDNDPYLLPGDSIACYDSMITNIAVVGRVLGLVGAVRFVKSVRCALLFLDRRCLLRAP